MTTSTVVRTAAERLSRAAADRLPCPPVRDLIDSADIATAYRVQQALLAERLAGGAVRVGRKIGLTSPAVQAQLGVAQPDFGVLLEDMAVAPGGVVPAGRLLQPRVEGEIAFRLGADLAGDVNRETVVAAVATAHAAIEIVDSRIAGWDISIADTVADNASSGMFVVSDLAVPLDEVEPVNVRMNLAVNGHVVSSGSGNACLGDPLNALEWLARTAAAFGDPLRVGEVILSGALGPVVAVDPGDAARVEMSSLGTVDVRFGTESE